MASSRNRRGRLQETGRPTSSGQSEAIVTRLIQGFLSFRAMQSIRVQPGFLPMSGILPIPRIRGMSGL